MTDLTDRRRPTGFEPDVCARRARRPGRPDTDLALAIERWFDRAGWRPFPFQRDVWQAMQQGSSGLLHADTGSGKTLACWLGALQVCNVLGSSGLKVLWITPMRALATDTFAVLQQTSQALLPAWDVQMRTGDTSASLRTRQAKSLPDALVTTPESLSLLMANAQSARRLGKVQIIIVDEWHELLASKRGVQVQLALAHLSALNPQLQVWAMSATLANLEHALDVLLPAQCTRTAPRIVRAGIGKAPEVEILLPQMLHRYAWAGQIGLEMAQDIARKIGCARSTLVFVNTRAQAERWYQALLQAEPTLAGQIALHHGSLDVTVRRWVEQAIKCGDLKAVICTSSLDLGVDFVSVEQVLQIGSCKGIGRLVQRAGRSGHRPDGRSLITLVPTHGLEVLEAVAACDALAQNAIEPRYGLELPMDVLVQHLVTIALGGGFEPEALYAEIRTTHAYRKLDRAGWQWALGFVSTGGSSLGAYPDYHRVVAGRPTCGAALDLEGSVSTASISDAAPADSDSKDCRLWRVLDRRIAQRHRMNIGTIVADSMMQVRYWARRGAGATLGQIEEGFVARLKPGECFVFAGRVLELVRVQDMTAYVRKTSASRPAVPRWEGSRMPLSTELSQAMVDRLVQFQGKSHPCGVSGRQPASHKTSQSVEQAWLALQPLLQRQQALSGLPDHDHLLIEQMHSREGTHWFFYPMAGRSINLAMASLIAWRLAQQAPRTFSLSVNDYGFELLSPDHLEGSNCIGADLFSTECLQDHLQASVNATELAQRRFREIARVAGLVFQGYPQQKKSARQIQASSQLFFRVFQEHDPQNRLLSQAFDEVMRLELDQQGLRSTLQRIVSRPIRLASVKRVTPFGFGLLVQRLGQRLSSEKLQDRVARMLRDLERQVL